MTEKEIEERVLRAYGEFFEKTLRRDERQHGEKIHISLSKIGGCPRYLIYSHLSGNEWDDDDTSEDILDSMRNWGVMLAGLWWEEFFAALAFPEFKRQCVVNLLGVKGHCDFLSHDKESGRVVILECKTKTEVPSVPVPAHVYQLSAYMAAVLENGYVTQEGEVVPPTAVSSCDGFLLYVCRDNPSIFKVFKVEMVPDVKKRLEDLLETVRLFETENKIPPIPKGYHPFTFPCYVETRYEILACPFHRLCWGEKVLAFGEQVGEVVSSLPFLEEGFRRWLQWKESEKAYRHFLEEVLKPNLLENFSSLEKSVSIKVSYLNNEGVLRFYRRRPPAKLNLAMLRRIIEQITSYQFPDNVWEEIVAEAKERDGEPIEVVEFVKIK